MTRTNKTRRGTAAKIRDARVGDIDVLTELDRLCFPIADRFPRRTWRHLLTTAKRNRSCVSIVVERAGTVIGAAAVLLRRDSRLARIYSLAVHPEARGGGLGRRLIAEVLARVPARCDSVSLEVRTTNAPALKLYASLGLRRAVILPAYYADYADAVRMRGALAEVRRRIKPAHGNHSGKRLVYG